MKKIIATHNKMMHADEITAIALLKIFTNDEYIIQRVSHDTNDFSKYDFVIDIGKKFNGIKYFDHHQYKGGKSSAGLIWDYLGMSGQYPKISKLIELVDKNDVGIEKAKCFEYSSLLKCFNHSNLNSKEQDAQFEKAVDFAITILSSMKSSQEELNEAKNIVANSYIFDGNPKIIELDKFNPHWTTYINGEVTPLIKAVVWEDEEENNWKVKIVPQRLGSFDLVCKSFENDVSMEFVHSSGHFAIAKDKETLLNFLRKQIK